MYDINSELTTMRAVFHSLIMRPHAYYLHSLYINEDLIDKTVLDVCPA